MCQGTCTKNTSQATSPAEARLRQALADIQKAALEQLQLKSKDGQSHPGAFAMQLIATLAEEGLTAPAVQPVTVHRARADLFANCGCRSTADCRCMAMDATALLLHKSHGAHRAG